MSQPNSNNGLPPVIHNPNADGEDPTDASTMLLASVSEQYGASIPATRFAKKEGGEKTKPKKRETVDTSTAKHGQLPMFLSKTYHMIDQTDPEVVTWSDNGDSFIIRDSEKFTTEILPKYFKHSNFSSFARQLNFYGFRKLKNEPILTNDYDAQKAHYISFFHDKFQRGKPDLLIEIKRASKTEQSTKSEVDLLKEEITSVKEQLINATNFYNHRLMEIVADYDRKFNQVWTELKPLLPNGITTPTIQTNMTPTPNGGYPIHNPGAMQMSNNGTKVAPGIFQTQSYPMQTHLGAPIHPGGMMQVQTQAAAGMMPTQQAPTPGHAGYTMQSLSHVAGVKLQSPSVQSQVPVTQPVPMSLADEGKKRSAEYRAESAANGDAKKSKTGETDSDKTRVMQEEEV